MSTSTQHIESCIESRETSDKRPLIMKNSICETRETSDERLSFMQNEPNFKNDQIYTSACIIDGYGNFPTFFRRKNEPKRTQNEPKLQKAKMNVSTSKTKVYDNFRAFCRAENKPKRTQNEPNFEPKLASVSRSKPNFKANYVKIGNLRWPTLYRNVFRFYSVFCVLSPVSFFVPNYDYKLLADVRKEF